MGLRSWVYKKTGVKLKNFQRENIQQKKMTYIIPHEKIEAARSCPVCDSKYTAYIQDVFGQRTQNKYPQYFCMDCQSFFHRSGYVESDTQQKADFDFLLSYKDRHSHLMGLLALELKFRLPGTHSVLEIGHGTGLFMNACQNLGFEATGFEVNPYCQQFAKDQLGVNSILGIFDDTHQKKYDLITAIQVFEHLENPRDLFKTMRNHLNPDGAIYLSVPFVERHQWKFLWAAGEPHEHSMEDVFGDNDVHITHFSIEGMKKMGLRLGARSAEYFVSKDVEYASPGSYHGVLFRF